MTNYLVRQPERGIGISRPICRALEVDHQLEFRVQRHRPVIARCVTPNAIDSPDAIGMTPPELFLGERALGGGGTVLPLENAYRFETNLLVVCCYRMTRRSELIAKAEECARLAQASDEAGVKYRYMIAADEWREMAEEKRFPKKRSSLFHRRGHKRHQPSARTS